MSRSIRSSLLRAGLAGLTAMALFAGAPAQAQEQKKFKIYLSMFVSGGGWITAASNAIKALAATPPYDKMVELQEVISGPEPQKQIAAYESMIASGADAIITLPASVTALNRTIKKGCDMRKYQNVRKANDEKVKSSDPKLAR